jgi:hypothetical protein
MKLLYCPHCQDVRKLRTEAEIKTYGEDIVCLCTRSWGRYTDELNAVYGGDAVMLGFANSTLALAIKANKDSPPERGNGRTFIAFIIPESAPTVKRETP